MKTRILVICFIGLCTATFCNAQLVDGIIGVKRTKVQQLLRPYHILDYQQERVVYSFDKGVRQTIIYENDTCFTFFWAVDKNHLPTFLGQLQKSGYSMRGDTSFVKGDILVEKRMLDSGKAILFYAVQDYAKAIIANNRNSGNESYSGKKVSGPVLLELPRMQQAILAEKMDTVPKTKNPIRNWVGAEEKAVSILGWIKE